MFGSGQGPHKFNNQNDRMHPDDRRNMIIFIVAAFIVYMGFDHFVLQPKIAAMRAEQMAARNPSKEQVAAAVDLAAVTRPRDQVVAHEDRLKIGNGAVFGTLPLKGVRIDDILLSRYFKTLGGKDPVSVLEPGGTAHPQFAEINWTGGDGKLKLPDQDTQWSVGGDGNRTLAPDHPVTLDWSNGQGLRFTRVYSIDTDYLLTLRQSVTNTSGAVVRLAPYGEIAEIGLPLDFTARSVAHQGAIGYVGNKLYELTYKTLEGKTEQTYTATAGWAGITEKYWLSALVPEQGKSFTYSFSSTLLPDAAKTHRYTTRLTGETQTLAPAATLESTMRLYVGAKEVRALDTYKSSLSIPHFDLAVDFGLYYFLTKPFFFILSFLGHATGNFGVAIVIFTCLLRAATFPLNNTSYRSFAKLKKVGPEMQALREKYGEDKAKLQKELVALYTREKVNPAAGCFPILVQIPIFFALYKVLAVTIEMRHAPFFGWIHDLSAPDPTSVLNLFGLLPYSLPEQLQIGVWPCLMMVGMILQRSMNPPPQDPVQAQMMRIMPFFMTFVMAHFAAGLVIYWTFSNILSVAQQYFIMRGMGVEVKFFQRAEAEKKLEQEVLSGPAVHPEVEMIEEEVGEALGIVSPPKPRRKKKK